MEKQDNIKSFIDYKFVPFKKSQCLKRIIIIWLIGFILCFLGTGTSAWLIAISIYNIIDSVVLFALLFKYSNNKISRFICDGVTYLHVSVLLNLASYRVIVIFSKDDWRLALILILLLLICICAALFIVLSNIKKNNYSDSGSKYKGIIPVIFGAGGLLFAQAFLQGLTQNSIINLLAILLMLLSLLIGMGSVQLLKVYFSLRIHV